jgi:hypothetical protein
MSVDKGQVQKVLSQRSRDKVLAVTCSITDGMWDKDQESERSGMECEGSQNSKLIL